MNMYSCGLGSPNSAICNCFLLQVVFRKRAARGAPHQQAYISERGNDMVQLPYCSYGGYSDLNVVYHLITQYVSWGFSEGIVI